MKPGRLVLVLSLEGKRGFKWSEQDGVTDLGRLEGKTIGDSDSFASIVTEQSKHTCNKIIKVCGK